MKIDLKSLLIGCVATATAIWGFNNYNIVAEANADTKPKQCVWSKITDGNAPELGEEGKIDMDEEWTIMSKEGWELKAVFNAHYIFEKCN